MDAYLLVPGAARPQRAVTQSSGLLVLVLEQCFEVDCHPWQRYRRDAAAAVKRLLIRPIGLSLPARQGPFVGMDAPDLEVTALLVVGQLGIDVIVSCRWRPDFDYQRQGVGEDGQYGAVPNFFDVPSWNNHQVWREDRGRGSPNAKLRNDRVRISIELRKQEMP